jgi:hypothetical protein
MEFPSVKGRTRSNVVGNKNLNTKILEEYSLKQNLFDPTKGSPNKFMSKLEHRMDTYYKSLYKVFKRNKK